eukprot:scaffold3586_cov404-Prasinococcus_capsulatus_cf.AAC.19
MVLERPEVWLIPEPKAYVALALCRNHGEPDALAAGSSLKAEGPNCAERRRWPLDVRTIHNVQANTVATSSVKRFG